MPHDAAAPIRVLIVDDSVVVRKVLSQILASDASIEVVGTAANGRIALHQIDKLTPDLVTLDLEMPEMNGLEALLEIRKRYPSMPVIVLSTATRRGAEATLELLSAGATDYCTKPEALVDSENTLTRLRDDLVFKIHALFPARGRLGPLLSRAPVRLRAADTAIKKRVDVVVLGISTGGPSALCSMIPQLPADFPVPILIVQHMPALFTAQLAQRLDRLSSLTVREGAPGEMVRPGEVWIAPGGFHMSVLRQGLHTVLGTNTDPPENSCRPAADVLFRSAAEIFGAKVLAVVMTGMGTDGLKGCEAVQRAGGSIFCQDEASSVVWSMPGTVANAGLAEKICSLEELASAITVRVREGRPLR